ncbi:MAG: hypothetical protein Q9168_001723 [Polycauliona sp. 1 TL-2023]
MPFCEHIQWLQFSRQRDPSLLDPGRLGRIVQELGDPNFQYPSLVFFAGRKAKDVAVRQLFPWNNFKKSARNDGLATLQAETVSLQTKYPLFFAESDPFAGTTLSTGTEHLCHESRSHPLLWPGYGVDALYDHIHSRLLFLFTDVICIFAEDFLDMDNLIHQLRTWAKLGRPTNLFPAVRPRVIVVRKGVQPSPSPLYDLLDQEDLRFNFRCQELVDYFSAVTVLHLADEQISPLSRHRRLKELLQRQVEEVRHARETYGCLYSAIHLNDLFTDAVFHTTRTIGEPFDFLLSSRKGNCDFTQYTEHLSTFLKLGALMNITQRASASYIASTILLDAYPPGMHRFDPAVVFTQLYQKPCLRVFEQLTQNVSIAERRTLRIGAYLTDLFATMQSSKMEASDVHKTNLGTLPIPWAKVLTNRTCLYCLRRRPEDPLSCGHAVCETCIRIFGNPQTDIDHRYHIDACILCRSGTLSVILKPPTAGISIVSIDGGGVRGAIPLQFLSTLQETLGDDCPIQDLFDLAFGTSSGGLIVLSLFIRQWGVDQCARVFDTITHEFFRSQRRKKQGIISSIRRFASCWLSDGIYDVAALERVLKDTFGTYERMFGSVQVNKRAKIAVTATTISDASPYIFSNYNGVLTRQPDCGYKLSRPENIEDEPFTWEASVILPHPEQLLITFQWAGNICSTNVSINLE